MPGVSVDNHVYFLKSLSDARAIRSRILECFERASYPNLTVAEQVRHTHQWTTRGRERGKRVRLTLEKRGSGWEGERG